MRFSIDANILVYSVDARDHRLSVARRIVTEAVTADCVLTNQALGEFLNVVRRKRPISPTQARYAAADWSLLFPMAPTSTDQLIAASALFEHHRLQFWDAVILTVAEAAGAECLLSEDMADGATINGVTLVNPFNPGNAELLDYLLAPTP